MAGSSPLASSLAAACLAVAVTSSTLVCSFATAIILGLSHASSLALMSTHTAYRSAPMLGRGTEICDHGRQLALYL